jgi:hypothetical protein
MAMAELRAVGEADGQVTQSIADKRYLNMLCETWLASRCQPQLQAADL